MSAIRVAIVGYGYAGRTFHAPLIEAVDGFTLCAIVSRDPVKVRKDRPDLRVISLGEALAGSNVDLVIVATPTSTHFEIAHRCLLAGKHVVVDKPVTVAVAEAETLRAAAEEANRIVTVFHNRRWDADFLTLRSLLAHDVLGPVSYFESRAERYRPVVKDRWRERAEPGSGTWYDLGSHLVDQTLQLFGEPDIVFGDLGVQRRSGATDFFHVLLRYGSMRAVLHGSSLAVVGGPRFHVLGMNASYVKHGIDVQEGALVSGQRPGQSDTWGCDPQRGVLTSLADGTPCAVEVPNVPGDYRAFYVAGRDMGHRATSGHRRRSDFGSERDRTRGSERRAGTGAADALTRITASG
jgi:predicted dehydrogenase